LFAIILFAFFLFIGNYSYQQMFAMKAEETALTKGNINEKNIAFTFNISWGEEKVYEILEVLDKEEISTTFFVSGEWAERHPQILEEITKKHELGMLGYRYKNYVEQEVGQVRKDIIYAKEVFQKLGHNNIEYIRPPSGHFNKEIIDVTNALEMNVIHWSINPNDWENPGEEEIIKEVKKAS